MNGTTLSKRNKRRFSTAATKYVCKNHSKPDTDFQAAMNIAVYKAFVAGCEYVLKRFNYGQTNCTKNSLPVLQRTVGKERKCPNNEVSTDR